jgi:hypothetical protein
MIRRRKAGGLEAEPRGNLPQSRSQKRDSRLGLPTEQDPPAAEAGSPVPRLAPRQKPRYRACLAPASRVICCTVDFDISLQVLLHSRVFCGRRHGSSHSIPPNYRVLPHTTILLSSPNGSLPKTNGPPPGPLASRLIVTLPRSATTRTVSPMFRQSVSHGWLWPAAPLR